MDKMKIKKQRYTKWNIWESLACRNNLLLYDLLFGRCQFN